MEKAFQLYLNSYKKICPEIITNELQFIRDNLTIRKLQKKEIYLSAGEIQKKMGFVYEGLLRSYYIDDQAKKVTISFIHEHTYASDYPSFIRQKKSKYFIECLEDCLIIDLPFETIQKAYSRFKNFERYGRLIAEQILLKKQDRLESFLFNNAETRYLNFLKNNEQIINRISLSHLSSYLGIERQSLSRIRKKLSQK